MINDNSLGRRERLMITAWGGRVINDNRLGRREAMKLCDNSMSEQQSLILIKFHYSEQNKYMKSRP